MIEARFIIPQLSPLPEDIKKENNIIELPSPLYVDDVEYPDNDVPFPLEEMCRNLLDGKRVYGSSQSAPGDYIKLIKEVPENVPVFVICLSSKLSAYYKSALAAQQECAEHDVTVIDTRATPPVMTLMALTAAGMARKASSIDELKAKVNTILPDMGQYWACHSLKYLHKAGRINAAQAFLGGLIKLVPIITPNADGELVSAAKARRLEGAMAKVCDLIAADMEGKQGDTLDIIVLHTALARETGQKLEQAVKERFSVEQSRLLQASYVTHRMVGPNAVSVAFYVHS